LSAAAVTLHLLGAAVVAALKKRKFEKMKAARAQEEAAASPVTLVAVVPSPNSTRLEPPVEGDDKQDAVVLDDGKDGASGGSDGVESATPSPMPPPQGSRRPGAEGAAPTDPLLADVWDGETDGPLAPATRAEWLQHGMEKVKFPNFSFSVVFFCFPGMCFEAFTLLALDERTLVELVVGVIGTVYVFFFLVFVQLWGTRAGRNAALKNVTFRLYLTAMQALPRGLQAVLPAGYWRGKTRFMSRFGALYEQFDERHINWIAGVHLFKAVLTAVFVSIRPTPENCAKLYIGMFVVFFAFALFFLVLRPHRRPLDDVLAVVLSFFTGMLTLGLAFPSLGLPVELFFTIVVYTAIASLPLTLLTAGVEWLKFRPAEEKAIVEEREKEEDVAKNTDPTGNADGDTAAAGEAANVLAFGDTEATE
jgi:hypothetical protein